MIRSIPPITSCGSSNKRRKVRSAGPVKFRIRGFQIQIGIGGLGERKSTKKDRNVWRPHIQTQTLRKKPLEKCSVGEPPKYPRRPLEEIFEDKKAYQIIIEMFHHQQNEIKVDVKEDILSIESVKSDFNYYKEFLIPPDVLPEKHQQTFKNGFLTIFFEKAKMPH